MDEDVSRKNPKETSPIPLTLEYLVLISLPTFYFRYFSYILRYILYYLYVHISYVSLYAHMYRYNFLSERRNSFRDLY